MTTLGILGVILVCIIVGVGLWYANQIRRIHPTVKTVMNCAVIAILIILLIQVILGVLGIDLLDFLRRPVR